jgi:hypothetical protein
LPAKNLIISTSGIRSRSQPEPRQKGELATMRVPGKDFRNTDIFIESFRKSSGRERYFSVLSFFIDAISVTVSVTINPYSLLSFDNA